MRPTRQMSVPSSCDAALVFPPASEMGRLCPTTDWTATSLGGPELVQVYNDAHVPFLGAKQPWALGTQRAMAGELAVESVPDQGSTFILRLPAS